ncbi:SDR family oxidoreductase [Corynebacterium sp. sy039]|uniref:SDR family oxidoreductase n=1 Tax=Corynebacterium sp. sy039 TaxID=2599641 RepID=UPI0011B4CB1A|nr:SDR family oxidoreductase [Corynebacterium sp. sy039]QDZ42596.1 SDR family oxidoreductase [Corynebacterium sp. sy039]
MTPTIVLLGATSEIGSELVLRICAQHHVVLAARRIDALADLEEKLLDRGALSVEKLFFDAQDLDSHRPLFEHIVHNAPGYIHHVIVAFGILGDQEKAQVDELHAAEIAHIDYTAQIVSLSVAADVLLSNQEVSTLTAFSSIAGWRARRANYVYGSTKAGLDAFCQGLTDRLHGSCVNMITVRPGFVIGAMTTGMKPAPLSVDAATVADTVAKTLTLPVGKLRSRTLWVPAQLRLLAWVMRIIPRGVWRKMPR